MSHSQKAQLPGITIVVGSRNPVKINAVAAAVSRTWPLAEVVGYEVPSGVAEQPFSDEETLQGATNRAEAALAAHLAVKPKGAGSERVVAVGLEGGVTALADELWSTVWAVVIDQEGNLFSVNGARFQVPEVIAEILRTGKEMGPVVENLVGIEDVRSKQGMIGVITNNFVNRTEEYSGIVKLALGLWYGRAWQESLKTGRK